MRRTARGQTSATPAQVWEVLGWPARWPEFDPFLRRVRGTHGPITARQTLVGVSRVGSLAIPVDVLEVVPGSRLVLCVHTAPGVRETVTHEVVPALRGGSDVCLTVSVEGLLAPAATVPLWVANAARLRLLVVRADRIARAARRAA